jgi:hypothetical protein
VLAYLRKGETFARPAAGFGIGSATAWVSDRDRVPTDRRALTARRIAGSSHKKHGMNLQVIASPQGDIL